MLGGGAGSRRSRGLRMGQPAGGDTPAPAQAGGHRGN